MTAEGKCQPPRPGAGLHAMGCHIARGFNMVEICLFCRFLLMIEVVFMMF